MNGLALCAGVGGLELGLRLALGGGYRTVCHVEREAFAAAVSVARMEDATLDQAPVWDDLATFDGRPWRGVVDLLSAGFPCPPFSAAGKRKGIEDDRWLWPVIAPIVEAVRPPVVFIEQVDDFLGNTTAFGRLLSDLHALGFDAEWALVSGATIGAPQLRERVFILAVAHGHEGRLREWTSEAEREREAQGRGQPSEGDGAAMADPGRERDQRRGPGVLRATRRRRNRAAADTAEGTRGTNYSERCIDRCGPRRPLATRRARTSRDGPGRRPVPCELVESLADADGERRDQAVGWESEGCGPLPLGIFPPGRDEFDAWARVLRSVPEVEPALCSMADGLASRLDESRRAYRSDQLRCVGNGVIPLAAALAFRRLAMRFEGVPSQQTENGTGLQVQEEA